MSATDHSEGFQCDGNGVPWLPIPLAISLSLQNAEHKSAAAQDKTADEAQPSHKDLKKIERLPLVQFSELCAGKAADVKRLHDLQQSCPRTEPALQPHIGMDRASGSSAEGLLYMIGLEVYRVHSNDDRNVEATEGQQIAGCQSSKEHARLTFPEIAFFLKLREDIDLRVVESALKRVCEEGWGRAKSRGLGYICFKSFEPLKAKPTATNEADGFVSLSHFCPARNDPTDGYWKLTPKHPVPPQFVDGRRVALGSGAEWRVKSFLRLRAGSCFRFGSKPISDHYGRMLTGLLDPAKDADGNELPELFHYALAYPWPMKLPPELNSRG